MSASIPPPGGSRMSKLTIALLVGGVVILGVAGFVVYQRRPPDPVPEPPPVAPAPASVPVPMVQTVPTRPIAEKDPDAGPDVLVEEKVKRPRRGGGGEGRSSEPTGTIDAKAANRLMNSNFSQVKACYERRLKVNPLLEGVLDLNIGVSMKGKVTSVATNRDTVRDAEMLGCVKKVIRSWKFPKPEGGRVVVAKTYKFTKKL